MSFNLNKLVQPECGAPNPLVRAAQQIASKSGGASFAGIRGPLARGSSSVIGQQANQLNFAREFASTATNIASGLQRPSSSGLMQGGIQQQQQPQVMNYPQMGQQHIPSESFQQYQALLRQQQQQQAGTSMGVVTTSMPGGSQSLVSAGDQLETKYRNDMISQTSSATERERLDDVEFWQGISQAYIGPTTFDNIAKMRAKSREGRTGEGENLSKTAGGDQQRQDSDELQQLEQRLQKQQLGGEETSQSQTSGSAVAADDYEGLSEAERQKKWEEGLEAARLMEEVEINDYAFDERNPLKDQFEDPFSEGLKRLEQGDIPSAALLFEAAVHREPDNALAWRYLGTTQAQNENDRSAIQALGKCLKLDSSDQQARLAISVSLVNETFYKEACTHLLQWLIAHDKYKSVNASLEEFNRLDAERSSQDPYSMGALSDQRHYSYVRDKFVEAARMAPNNPDPEVQNSLGVLFNIRGEYEKAVDCFKAALSVQSSDSLLWNRLGATLANSNKSDEAVIAYRRALEIAPGFLRSRYNLAISLIHLNLYDEAAKQLVQVLNTQAAGRGSKNAKLIRMRSITSTSIWNTLRTVATLMNKPNLYPLIDGRQLDKCNELLLPQQTITTSQDSSQPQQQMGASGVDDGDNSSR